MNTWRIYCILIWLLFTVALLPAQPPEQPKITHLDPSDYGGDNQNWDIAQGEDRTIYVANSAGVLANDGARWGRYDLPGRPVVRAIAYDRGKLYAGGYGEFGYFQHLGQAQPQYVSLAEQLPDEERSEEIWNIVTLDDGTVIFHSFARLYAFREGTLIANEAPGILLFARGMGDHLIVPITGRGLHRWSPAIGFSPIAGSEALGGHTVRSFLPWRGGFLVGTEDTTFHLRGGRLQATPLPDRVNRLLPLKDGRLAVGTIGEGIYLFDDELSPTLHLTRENGLGNNTVLALWQDAAADLWIGLDQGLSLLDLNSPLRFSETATEELGTVYSAIQHEGTFYLGTNQGLFARPTAGDAPFSLLEGTAGQVWSLQQIGGLLLCAHNEGTYQITGSVATLLDGTSGVWATVPHPTDPSLFAQATYTGLGLLSLSVLAARQPAIDRLAEYVAPLRYTAWVGPGELLAAHASSGVVRINARQNPTVIVSVDTIGGRIGKPVIVRIGDTVIVQNAEAIHAYGGERLEPLATFRGVDLPEGSFCLPGREGTRDWFLITGGKTILYNGARPITTVSVRLDANYPTILPWPDGRYLLCLNDGYAFLDPSPQLTPPPKLHLQAVEAGPGIRVFAASLPAFDRPVRYRYRLTDRQETWSDWSDRSTFEFYELWEGKYRFEVAADWFGAVESVEFTIVPPWYRSGLAYALYALAVAGLLLLLYRLHRRRLHVTERRLELVRRRQLQRQRMHARNRELEERVTANNRELANTTLALAKKNEILLQLREQLDEGRPEKVRHLIDRNLNDKEDWAIFEDHFNEVHDAYLRRLRQLHPTLTSGDLQLAAYLKMDLPSKEIAPLLHISLRGVENKRYRLRKKLGLEGEQNLNQYLMDL